MSTKHSQVQLRLADWSDQEPYKSGIKENSLGSRLNLKLVFKETNLSRDSQTTARRAQILTGEISGKKNFLE